MPADRVAEQAPSVIAIRLAEMAVTSEMLVEEQDLSVILQRIAARARDVTRAEYAAISTFAEDGRLERFIYAGMSDEAARQLGDPPRGRGILGELARRDRPLLLDDIHSYAGFTGWPPGHPDMSVFLGVPMRAGGRTIGSLYMARTDATSPFDELDQLSASLLGLQAAASVAGALARERRGRVSLLEERERIAHDLHDGTIQSLYALGLEFDAVTNRPDAPAEVRALLTDGVERINQLIGDIRGYITMLEADSLAEQPELSRDLAFIVRQLVPAGVDTVVNITAAALQELTARDAEDLLNIAREALSNAVRHGKPSKIAIDVRQTPDETALTVQDNGVGFDAANARRGLGTVTMQTRAERLGGKLSILGIPGMGTTVRVAISRRSDD